MAQSLTDLQKRTAQAIVNIFETGSALGNYGAIALIQGDTGHLTYGRSQTTLASGNLYLLVKAYCGASGARFASALSPYLSRLAERDFSLDTDMTLRGLLQSAASDPVMRVQQDQFFDRGYWDPSVQAGANCSITTALGITVVYDGHIQGAWQIIRDKTDVAGGQATSIGEKSWIGNYVNQRRHWLATNPNPALHPTVYRMDVFLKLINGEQWDLPLPLAVRGVQLTEDLLADAPAANVSGQSSNVRLLSLQTPPLQGSDVSALQLALVRAGAELAVDGVFGNTTDTAVRQFQSMRGLPPDGIVGSATRSALGL